MKKNLKFLLLISLSIFSFDTFSQEIFSSIELENNEPKEAHFIFAYGEKKNINDDIESYLLRFGRTNNSENIHSVELNQKLGQSEYVSNIVCELVDMKSFNKLVFFFLDQNKDAVTGDDLYSEDIQDFIFGLYDLIRKNAEKRQIIEDFKLAESNVEEAEKAKGKIEKNIERNLRDQEKLGKRLDATPEELTQLINVKNTVLQEKLSGESDESEREDLEDLDKKISKTEKAIVKRQKKEQKDESKLEQKEKQLKELSKELFAAQEVLKDRQTVFEDKKRLMKVLNY